jgi:3-keto-5-aminohexanoate cleavage enzyme
VTGPVILTCAVSGGFITGNPNQPNTRADVVSAVLDAARAGASVVHIHARAEGGGVSQAPEDYAAIRDAVRAEDGEVVLNFTTGGSWGMSFDERRGSLAAQPDMASLNAGSLNFGPAGDIYENPKWFIDELRAEMTTRGVFPEYECFDIGMAASAVRAAAETPGLLHMVLGVIGGAPPTVETLCHFASLVPPEMPWMATAIGRDNFPIMAAAVARGGHVRTGLEDVVYTAKDRYAGSN